MALDQVGVAGGGLARKGPQVLIGGDVIRSRQAVGVALDEGMGASRLCHLKARLEGGGVGGGAWDGGDALRAP